MPIFTPKPTTNGRRNISFLDNSMLTVKKPTDKSLLSRGKKINGRSHGTISIRHRGGGTRPQYRKIDFNQTDKLDIPATVKTIEYDPNRTAAISLVAYKDGEKRYIIAHKNIKVGDTIITSTKAKLEDGNRMQIQNIPVGFYIFNIEIMPNKGAQMVRSAGQKAKIVSLDGDLAQIQLASGEIRLIRKTNYATIGTISNEEWAFVRTGKAGRVRHRGRRPQVLGKSMNPCDHPHGGGEGHTSIGMKYPKTPWGAHALGVKTRRNKITEKFILQSRHRSRKK